MKSIFISILFVALTTSSFAGGGWPLPKGNAYLKLSEWWLISDQHYTDAGRIDPNQTTGIFNTSLYAEYGFTDRLTGVLYFPFFSRTFNNNILSGTTGELLTPGASINSLGDTDLSFKYGLNAPGSKVAIAATLTFGIPLGNSSGGPQGNLQTGDGEFNQMIGLDAGTGWEWGGIPFYTNVNLAFNNRTNQFSDEVRYGWELGANLLNKKLWVIGRLNGIESLMNGATAATSNATSIFANNSEFLSLGAEIAYNISPDWGVSIGAANAVSGQIIFASPSYTVGVFKHFR